MTPEVRGLVMASARTHEEALVGQEVDTIAAVDVLVVDQPRAIPPGLQNVAVVVEGSVDFGVVVHVLVTTGYGASRVSSGV